MPRPLEGATNADVTNANGTLAHLLGGRTKSWMTGAHSPVRPTPRPTKPTAPPGQAGAVPNEQTQAQSVTSTSNTNTNVTLNATPNALLSPTPSLEEGLPHLQHAAEDDISRPSHGQTSSSPLLRETQQLDGRRGVNQNLVASHNLQEGIPMDPRPSQFASLPVLQELTQRPTGALQIQAIQSPEQIHSTLPRTHAVSNMPTPIRTTSQNQGFGNPYNASMAPVQPHTRPSQYGQESFIPAPKRQRIQPPAMPSLQSRIPMIQQHITSTGGTPSTSLERPRFGLIEQACREEDMFYVALHQLFCSWDVHHQRLPNLPYIPSADGLQRGFRILGQLIKSNAEMAPVHLAWFSNFPSPLETLIATSEPYRQSINAAREFLFRLGNEWDKLSDTCRSRGIPPLVDEIVGILGCLSPILQQIIFTASRRNLGYEDEDFGPSMEEIFRQDRSTHRALSQRMNTSNPPTHMEITKRNDELFAAYIGVRQRQQQALMSRNGTSIRRTSGPQMAGPSNGNMMRQGIDVSRSPANIASGTRMAPVPVASRSSICHGSTVAPSPTLLQNLSIYPPGYAPSVNSSTRTTSQSQSQMPLMYPSQFTPQTSDQHAQRMHQTLLQTSLGTPMQVYDQAGRHLIPVTTQQQYPIHPQQLAFQQHNQQAQLNGNAGFHQRHRIPQSIPLVQQHTKSEIWIKTHPLERSIVPPLGYVIPAQPVVPELTALHQAHVRSPKLAPADLTYSGKFYQAIKGFALEPIKYPFTEGTTYLTAEFSLQAEDWALIAKDISTFGDKLATRLFRRGTTQFRFRCVQTRDVASTCSLSEWSVSETAWPEHIFASMNALPIEFRRKVLHGKDQPVDVTTMMQEKNTLKLSISKSRSVPRYYFIAVEVVEILQHDQILKMCSLNRITIETTLASIKKALAPINDDDDMMMVVDDLTIDIADPFMARIFEVPARSVNCLHRECFDLETFLQTRNSKPRRAGAPCMIDQWKCPLCGNDARPYNLRIDDFLVSVRAKLEQDNKLDVKAILVSENGSWRPKAETVNVQKTGGKRMVHDEESSNDEAENAVNPATHGNPTSEKGVSVRASAIRSQRPEPQVIDLDSD